MPIASEQPVTGYRERRSRLPGVVAWERPTPEADPGLVLPDGCMDLIWTDGTLIVAGPDTHAHSSGEPATYAGLRFAPGMGPAVLGVPAAALRDQRVPLAQLWPAARVRRLADRVTGADNHLAALEDVAAQVMPPSDPALALIVKSLDAGAGVAQTAALLDMGERRLHRRCLDAFGYGPKTLARILRMNRALALARAGTPFATVAAQAGYADQAHLARDVKDMAGVPLSSLVG
ncbi:AraC family transcriptional regulator [Rhizocola hellebori]|uniref:AraC family transcriptional regulator n=1 Tax=Rhizocola hellebori TaxID=1392758 RepID=A0A8J3Q9D0_9ACTN|nr:helix-turn-helix transcriptional regulator [Rhizocola hellebori]GIH06558.1 AraC family transcriptional regulator [Rhizocola hellebori]